MSRRHGEPREILLKLVRRESSPSCFQIAGARVITDVAAGILEPFRVILPSDSFPGWQHTELSREILANTAHASHCTKLTAWIGNAQREIHASYLRDGLLIEIDGLGQFAVLADRAVAARIDSGPPLDTDQELEIALGPMLSILLAQSDVFCMHASAISRGGEAVCLVGESGSGKSTLAAYLHTNNGSVQRFADDVVPLRLDSNLNALPAFPQLKLPVEEQAGSDFRELAVAAVIELKETPKGTGGVQLEEVSRAECCLMLARHTVAARLFGSELLSRHLEFCAGASAQVRSYVLTYPHEKKNLPLTLELLRAKFGWR